MSEDEPYLEHIESKEIKKLAKNLYQNQPDQSQQTKDAVYSENPKEDDVTLKNQDSFDHISSKIDNILENSDSLEDHSEYTEQTSTPLPDFPAIEKPKEVEKPRRPEKKRGFFGFFKK